LLQLLQGNTLMARIQAVSAITAVSAVGASSFWTAVMSWRRARLHRCRTAAGEIPSWWAAASEPDPA